MEIEDRDHLARYFAEAGFNTGAEIGVAEGAYSMVLLSSNPNLKLYSIDSWAPYGHFTPSWQKKLYYHAKMNLHQFGKRSKILKMTSMEALLYFENGSLDFVYIDGGHDFDNVMMDIIGWSRKVRSRGIIAGHDYINLPGRGLGIVPAVDMYVKQHGLKLHLTKKDKLRSFFWEKP